MTSNLGKLLPIIFIAILMGKSCPIEARIILPAILSDHMVLQQKQEVSIWGWTTQSSDQIRVWGSWNQDTLEASAKAGRWELSLPTPEAGGPYQIVILGKRGERLLINDVLIGEVWLASGQSNMEMRMDSTSRGMQGVINYQEEIAGADFPQIRLFKVERRTALSPQDDFLGKWVVCSPEEARNFSAVAYYFSRKLHKKTKLPIGCVMSCWGGTAADAWTPKPELLADPIVAKAAEGVQGNGSSPRAPGILFNAMIHPMLKFRIAGTIWYQGESNRGRPQTYQALMVRLIESWRSRWGYEFPFYFVQIAPYDYSLRNSPNGPYLREAQLKTLLAPQTGMAVTADVGDAANIHPRRKREVGERLARWALAKDYGFEKMAYSGPLFHQLKVRNNKAIVSFRHTGRGLIAKGKVVNEAFIAGQDRVFYPAEAVIEHDKLILSSPKVVIPVAVRYGFSDTDQMNLFNKEGLPASPFRTDNWKHETVRIASRLELFEWKVSAEELAKWPFWGKGIAEVQGDKLLVKESNDSKGVMLVSPKPYGKKVLLRYEVQALTTATVVVSMLSASDEGNTNSLSIPASYDGGIGLWYEKKENYFFAFRNAPHGRTPFLRRNPGSGSYLAIADKNLMLPGQYYQVEVGTENGKLWLSIDGEKVFEARDPKPVSGGHMVIRLRGTAGYHAACLIRNVRIYEEAD